MIDGKQACTKGLLSDAAGRGRTSGAVVTKAAAGQGKRWHDLHQRYVGDIATADLLTVWSHNGLMLDPDQNA